MDNIALSSYNSGQRKTPAQVRLPRAWPQRGSAMTTPILSPIPDGFKRCTKCGEIKPLDAFHRYSRNKSSGRQPKCRDCKKAYARRSRAASNPGYKPRYPDVLPPDGFKLCGHCGEVKSINQFGVEKRTKDGLYYACKKCTHVMGRAEYQRNRDAHLEYHAGRRDLKSEYDVMYREQNADRIAEAKRQYRMAHRTEVRQQNKVGKARRRARMVSAGGSFTTSDLAAIRAAQTDAKGRLICWRCGKPIKDTPHLDHWIPFKHGGPNSAGNLHFMHARCNLEKGAKLPSEIGRLL